MTDEIRAPWPGRDLFPSAALYPSVPANFDDRPVLTSSTGSTVPAIAVLGVSGTVQANILTHTLPTAPALTTLRPVPPATITLRILLESHDLFRHLVDLYAQGATVTLTEPGNPWTGLRHVAAGALSYTSLTQPGRPALLEATIEVTEA